METQRFTQHQIREWRRDCHAKVMAKNPNATSLEFQKARQANAYLQWGMARTEGASVGEITFWKRQYDFESCY